MEGKKLKSPRGGRLGRAALLVAVAGVTAGGMLLGAAPAHAAVGTGPGVTLSPATGPTTTSPTYSTNAGCPSGDQGSAVLKWVPVAGVSFIFSASLGTNSVAAAWGPIGMLNGDSIATLQSLQGDPNGSTVELVVYCFPSASEVGTPVPFEDVFLTISADGATYTTSSSPPSATATTTTLTAAPSPATTGQTVTLSATVSAADTTTPAGTVQFQMGGTNIGTAVSINSGGTASTAMTTTTFATAGAEALSAIFTPTSSSYASSTGTFQLIVNVPTSPTTGTESLAVTIPATGAFTMTVGTGTVNLVVNTTTATGALNTITVSDTRNTYPGWSVSGQESTFVGSGGASGQTISGNQLGWTPTDTSLATGAVLGSTVAPVTPGLGTTAAVLASAVPGGGVGTSALGANLLLDIPTGQFAGSYAGTMTITAVTTGP